MRVTAQDVDEFLQSLRIAAANGETVFNRTVYASRFDIRQDEVRTLVNVKLSAVMDFPESDGQYLIQTGEDLGIDYAETPPELNGSVAYKAKLKKIQACCKELGLSLRPGVVDF
jgi:hypothetical protein